MNRRIPALTLFVCSWCAAQTAPPSQELDRRLMQVETDREQGRLAAAEPLVTQLERDVERVEGPGQRLAAVLREHGLLRDDADRPREAIPYYERALAMLRALPDLPAPSVALVIANLAGSHSDAGDFDQALSLSAEAMAMLEAAGQKDTPVYAVAQSAHGFALHGLGRIAEALRNLRASLSILQRMDQPKNPQLAVVAEGIGACLFDLGYTSQAEASERQALDIRMAFFGPDSLPVAISNNNLGVMLAREQRFSEGQQLLERSAQSLERIGEDEIRRLDSVLGNLGRVYVQQARNTRSFYGKAEDIFRRQLAIEERIFGDSDVRESATLESLGEVLYRERSYNEAGQLYGRGVALQKAALGPADPAAVAAARRYSVLAKKMSAR